MKLKIFLTVLLTFMILSFSAMYHYSTLNYSKIDSVARTIKFKDNIDELVLNLTDGLTEEHLRARSIFTWITFNIDYDCKGLKGKSTIVYKPEEVLESRVTVCSGYSYLFQELCKKANLECKVVSGWTKISKKNLKKIDWKNSDHAWNAIKLNGKWELIDVTWASGYSSKNCSQYIKEFKDEYFCMDPNLMILKHYPENEKWKLGVSINKEQFESFPLFYHSFFSMHIKNLNQMNKYIEKNIFGKAKFTFETNKKIEFIITTDTRYPLKYKNVNNLIKLKAKSKKSKFCLYINGEAIVEYLNK